MPGNSLGIQQIYYKTAIILFLQAVFPLFKTTISFKFSERKYENRFSHSNSNPGLNILCCERF